MLSIIGSSATYLQLIAGDELAADMRPIYRGQGHGANGAGSRTTRDR